MKVDPTIAHEKQRILLEAAIALYGDDSNLILNALQELTARIGIGCGVEPEAFAAGMKHHWDGIANFMNDYAERRH